MLTSINSDFKKKSSKNQTGYQPFRNIKDDTYITFLNPYQSKHANFEPQLYYHKSNYFQKSWNESTRFNKPEVKKVKINPDAKKLNAFKANIATITQKVATQSEKASMTLSKKAFKSLDQKIHNPTPEEKVYFGRYGLPDSVLRQKRQRNNNNNKNTNYDPHLDFETVKDQFNRGQLLEGAIRFNEFNSRIAYVTVEGVKNDFIIASEYDHNRALDRDQVYIRLVNPKFWDPMKEGKGAGADNNKPIEKRVIDAGKDRALVGDGIEIKHKTKSGDDQADDLSPEKVGLKIEENKGDDVIEAEADDNSDDWITQEDENSDENLPDINQDGEGDDEQKTENDQDILKLIKKRKAKMLKDKEDRKDKDKDNGLVLPSDINTTQKLIEWINTVAIDFRPKGKVVHIKESKHFGKDIVMILKVGEKGLLSKITKMDQEQRSSFIEKQKEDEREFLKANKILAIPINKRLKWSLIESLPHEFWDDLLNAHDPCKRYYLCKLTEWKNYSNKPKAKIISSLGNAGDIDAETMRILKQYDLFELEYPQEVLDSLKVFEEGMNKETKEWRIPEEELKKRVDLRETRIFTCDPTTAKDLDDALSITKIDDETYEVGVHIADVSYFVEQGSALDKEARNRATSVYFVHLVIPMLPRLLCENL